MVEKILPGAELELGIARSVDERLTHRATGAPCLWETRSKDFDLTVHAEPSLTYLHMPKSRFFI